MLSKSLTILIILFALNFSLKSHADENPDKLYRQGRFDEAEKAYARSDMDHPKDIRYRYNRGCAAYQNSDYQSAMAAFSSVLTRAKDDKIRFKAAYNLGNTAFKQRDFESAAAYYKKAILYNPESENARHNLELAIRELEKLKKEKTEKQKTRHQKHSSPSDDQKERPESARKGESPDKSSNEGGSNQEQHKPPEQRTDKGQGQAGRERKSETDKDARSEQGQRADQESPKDLTGKLEPLRGLPEQQGEDNTTSSAMSLIDKKMAEALLDNIKEDRSRFLRFQIPPEKRKGVQSGKDW